MDAYRAPIVLGTVILYILVCMGVGLWALTRTHSTRDFFMAGRSLGVVVTGLAIFSSTLSGFGFVGGPGLVYATGMSSIWMVIVSSVGYAVAFFLVAKRLRLIAELRDTVSLPGAVHARYRSNAASLLTSVAILLGVMGYLASQILAMATVLESILADSGVAVGFPASVALSSAVLIFYCVTGGIIASVYTDVVQGAIMILAGTIVFIAALSAVDGGMSGISLALAGDDPESIGPFGTVGMLGCLGWYLLFGLGLAGQPHIVTKMMMNRRVSDARHILPLSLAGFGFAALLWIGIGLAMRALVVEGSHPQLARADLAAPAFLTAYAHPLLAGVVFAGLFAAIMSTADSFLNIGAAALVHDLPRALRGRPPVRELFWARLGTIGLAVAAAGFALYSHYVNDRLVALLGAFGWATFAAALVPVVAIGMNWKRATAPAACAAILVSLIVNFTLQISNLPVPYGIDGGALSILVSLVAFITISLLSKPPVLDRDIEAVMDL
jgi:SSS family transporter